MQPQIRKAGESRGFEVSRLVTHWAEVVGQEIAAIARPVNVSYGRGGFGATLTLLTTGAHAPILQMQLERLRERVNTCYGYSAIRRIRITQTAPAGFAEGQASFAPAPKESTPPAPTPDAQRAARHVTESVADTGLRQALEALGGHIISKANPT